MVNMGLHTPWTISPLSGDLGQWTLIWTFLGEEFAPRAVNSACRRSDWRMKLGWTEVTSGALSVANTI